MPYINARFSTAISDNKKEELKSKLGQAITLIGKSEAYLMVEISENCNIYFKGNCESNCAFFEVKLLGKSTRANYEKLTSALCDIAQDMLGINGDRVYVKFEEVEHWGYNSFMF